jgi:Bacterial Ig-like domain (group 3)
VSKASPAIVTHASGPVVVGGNVTDTATLSGGVSPTGTITFTLFGPGDATCTGTPVLTSTKAVSSGNGDYTSDPFSTVATGSYNWVAAYSGDANNAATATNCGDTGESAVIGQASTTTTVVSSLDPSVSGQAVTFTAMVTGTGPTGTVTFKDRSSTLGTGTLGSGGAATFTTSSLSAGSHGITAVYGGDANNLVSSSSVLPQVVNKPAPGLPSVSVASPASGASYRFGHLVRASYRCNEGKNGPGIVSCTGPVPSGSRIDTRTVGTHTFAVTAVSGDGKRATDTVVYRVLRPSNHFTVSPKKTHPNGTVTFNLKLPGPGIVNVLETAWNGNFASAASLLQPAARRFVFARERVVVTSAGRILVAVKPNKRGLKLIAHHRYRVTIRLWISYTPTGGLQRNAGAYGLHFPG